MPDTPLPTPPAAPDEDSAPAQPETGRLSTALRTHVDVTGGAPSAVRSSEGDGRPPFGRGTNLAMFIGAFATFVAIGLWSGWALVGALVLALVADQASPGEPDPRYGPARVAGLVAALVVLALGNIWVLAMVLAVVVMITLHELGHYLTAKRAGMKVTEFFLGFGPRIWSIQRGETEYGIKCIPAGAYVKIPGMVNLDEVAPEDEERTYRQKPFGARVSVAVAGSAMHFMLALVLLYVSLVFIGLPGGEFSTESQDPPPVVEEVFAGSGAANAGLQPGDEIKTIGGEDTPTSSSLRETAAPFYGSTVPVMFLRDGQEQEVDVALGAYSFEDGGDTITTCGLGIGMAQAANETVGPVEGLVAAPKAFANIFWLSVKGLGSFFSPSGISSFGSQVGNAQEDRQQTEEQVNDTEETCEERAEAILSGTTSGGSGGSGATGENRVLSIVGLIRYGGTVGGVDPGALIALFALINIFIGIFNLVPLLPFDGGHVAIAVYENIQERRLHRRRYFADVSRLLPLTYVVVLLLGMLFVSSLYLDVVNPIGG